MAKPKIFRMNGYTGIDDVVINLSPPKEYTALGKIYQKMISYQSCEIYLKQPGAREVINLKGLSDFLGIHQLNTQLKDIRITGPEKSARKAALLLYRFVTCGDSLEKVCDDFHLEETGFSNSEMQSFQQQEAEKQ